MGQSLNVMVAQSPGDLVGPQARLDWLKAALDQRGERRVDLMVLPELFLTGYNIGNGVREWAEDRDGAFSRRIADLARSNHLAIHFGYAERDGDRIYNASACYGRDGEMIGHHRKLLLPPGFEGDHFSPGQGYSRFRIGDFTIATLICYDAEFPENFRRVATTGADLVVVPTALAAEWGIVSEKVMPTRAFENGVYVIYANHCNEENGLRYFGGSCIISPGGKDLARADRGEAYIFAQFELAAVKAARSRLPYHDDILKLPGKGSA